MSTYNITRWTRQVLKRHRKSPPSVVVHLYPTFFRFEHQVGNYAYDSPMKCFLEAIREQTLPTDMLSAFDQAGIPWYEGCLIVEVHDHRGSPAPAPTPASLRPTLALSFATQRETPALAISKAEIYRIILGPNPATLWNDIGILEQRWQQRAAAAAATSSSTTQAHVPLTEDDANRIEAEILSRTVTPLCLSPSIQVSRIANSMLNATTVRPPKRKRFCATASDESAAGSDVDDATAPASKRERDEREKWMKIGDEGVGRGRGLPFSRLAFIQSLRERQAKGAPAGGGITTIKAGSGGAAAAAATRDASPAVSVGRPRKSTAKAVNAYDSDSTTASTSKPLTNQQQQQKKKLSLSVSGAGLDAAEAAEKERKKALAKKKREEKKREKERLKRENAGRDDLQVAPSPAGSAYSWTK